MRGGELIDALRCAAEWHGEQARLGFSWETHARDQALILDAVAQLESAHARIAELEAERDQERRKAERWQEVARLCEEGAGYYEGYRPRRCIEAMRQAESGTLDPEPSDRIRERTADFAPPDERAYTVGDALGLRRTDDPEPER